MKNITEILTGLGIQIPEDKKADFDKQFAENYKTIVDYDKQKLKLTQAQESLQTAQDGLAKFNGVDVAALQSQIAQLKNDLTAKDAVHAQELADRDFDALLDTSVRDFKGRSVKAIRGELDIDALKASKNQAEDIKAALETLKADSSYLFDDGPTPPPYAGGTGTQGAGSEQNAALRAAFGLSSDK